MEHGKGTAMPADLYKFKNDLEDMGVFFSFCGPVTQELLVEIGEILKLKMKLKEAHNNLIIKVFSMVVEMAQNIIHYSAERSFRDSPDKEVKQISHGVIAVGYQSDHYFVLSGNVIHNSQVENLREKLSLISAMNKDEIRDYYRKQRRAGPGEGSKGAGLGLLEMARKSNRQIEFAFKKIDNDYSFFSIKNII